MRRPLIAVATGGAVALLGAGVVVPMLATAQGTASPTPSASPSAGPDGSTRQQRQADRQAELAKLLAAELGISEQQVAEALTKVRDQLIAQRRDEMITRLSDRLDAAVKAGTLTRAQADAILAAAKKGLLPFGGGHGLRGMAGGGRWAPDAPPDGSSAPSGTGAVYGMAAVDRA